MVLHILGENLWVLFARALNKDDGGTETSSRHFQTYAVLPLGYKVKVSEHTRINSGTATAVSA